ncbi:MAG: DUF1553 domain-containing protein [Planctomycetaceae bacterium]
MRLFCLLMLLSFRVVNEAAFAADAVPKTIRFNDHIRPILSEHCFACHGRDSGSRKGELRLDVRNEAVDGGAIVPGDAKASALVERITSADPDVVMPPPDSHKTLSPEQKQILIQWINDGAKYQQHWAFIKPVRPDVPQVTSDKAWTSNPIDAFIVHRLNETKLTPNPMADRYTLARRAALDITGLPPTAELPQMFVADTSDNAWETYIDQLLASEHAGEHRARYWLDAARYGDTHGMHVDNYREMWPYRDWVVQAFNSNMPFDRFVIEQIAGDLLPTPTRDQLIATGFSRCNITTSEGGAIPAELDVRYMVDRVETMATVFLGLTAGCAVCHDHKYDPISQREFYQLGAFFNNTTAPAMDGNQKDTPPVVTLPPAELTDEWDALMVERERLRAESIITAADVPRWWKVRSSEITQAMPADELVLNLPLTEDDGALPLPKGARWAPEHPAGQRGMRFDSAGGFTAKLPAMQTSQPLSISFWIRTPDELMSTNVMNHTATTKDKKTIGWKISTSTQGALTFELHDGHGKNIRGLLPGESALIPRAWQHVCVRYSGGQSNSSISILVNGVAGVLRNSTEDLIDDAEVPAAELKIASQMQSAGLSDLRIYQRCLTDAEIQALAQQHSATELLATQQSFEELSPQQRELAELLYRTTVNEKSSQALQAFGRTQTRRDYIYSRSTTTMVMQERETAPRAWVLNRGEYDQPREEVGPWIPAVLDFRTPGFEAADRAGQTRSPGRLELARWLVHPDHPLTARVMVNRLWQSVFGTGLVKTSEDFGVMGDRPSHPELLDWLAVEFVESGWNVNHLLKLLLMSSTYRQSSVVTPEKLAVDADNRYLARGPRLRLDAEVLRDQALAVSGLLKRSLGGPSVKPYQPAGLWKVVAITGSNTRVFEKDTGDALYRRSLYTFWKRTSPPPSMAAFNAPTREQCTVRRERTNTPIQALVLMNDPQYVECARHLAQHTLHVVGDDSSRAAWMLEHALKKPAVDVDVADLVAAVSELRNTFEQQPEAATKLIRTGDSPPDDTLPAAEVAAWTIIANTIMNRDDFVSK